MSKPLEVRARDAAVPALANAVINGAIAYFGFRADATVPVSLDLISTTERSVWGEGVVLALGLGIILSIISAKVFAAHVAKSHPEEAQRVRRSFLELLRLGARNAASLFGWFVAAAVLWQRTVGVVRVPSPVGAALVGALAAVATVVIQVRTQRALLDRR